MSMNNTSAARAAKRNTRLLCSLALAVTSLAGRQAVAGHWNYNQPLMTEGRAGHTATLMLDGPLKYKVIIAGGNIGTRTVGEHQPLTGGKATASVDLYSENGSVTPLPPMYFERLSHTATALADGTLLVAGGTSIDAAATSEVYDPNQHAWSRIHVMNEPRANHTATLLPNGMVLAAGGCNPRTDAATASAETFNAGTQSWNMVAPMQTPRCSHTATLLSNGKVLVVGGISNSGGQLDNAKLLQTTELFDPKTNTWERGPDMAFARAWHNATCIDAKCSEVLIAGGAARKPGASNEAYEYKPAEIYNVATNQWFPARSMLSPRGDGTTMARLSDGRVIAMGGRFAPANAEIYDVYTDRWQAFTVNHPPLMRATAVELASGNVLFSGGTGDWRYHVPSSQQQIVYDRSGD
jgi:hypothetical protein